MAHRAGLPRATCPGPFPPGHDQDIDQVLRIAIHRCSADLDARLQEVTREGPTSSWDVKGDVVADLAQALSALIRSASASASEGSQIVLTLAPLERTVTVAVRNDNEAARPSRTLFMGVARRDGG